MTITLKPLNKTKTMMKRREKSRKKQIPTLSLISRALLHKGSASLYFPLLPYKTAKLFKVAATYERQKIQKFIF